jgi:hypothetical protein
VLVLVDSNVLIFSVQQGHPWHEESIKALEFLLAADEAVCVFLQNIAEFWNVCTRPADRTPAVYPEWRKIGTNCRYRSGDRWRSQFLVSPYIYSGPLTSIATRS